jgi:RNA polymerase sigma-70 factor (ECF subfamily)
VVTERVADGATFAEWVRPHLAAMAYLAERLAPGDGDDVVQDALTRAWRRWGTYDAARGTPRTWLLAIVSDQSRRARLRRRPTVELVDVAAPEGRRDDDLALEAALRRLPRRQRLAVALHYFVGLPVAECAAVMGCAEGTVKSTLFDARRRLREELGDD